MKIAAEPQRRKTIGGPGIRDLLLIVAGVAVGLAAERYQVLIDREMLRRFYTANLRGVLDGGLTVRSVAAAISGGGIGLALVVLSRARTAAPSPGRWCTVLLGGYAAVAHLAALLSGWAALRFEVRYGAGIPLLAWGQLAGAIAGAAFSCWRLSRRHPSRVSLFVWIVAVIYFVTTIIAWIFVNAVPSVGIYPFARMTHQVVLVGASVTLITALTYEWWTAGKDWIVGSAAVGLTATLLMAMIR